MLNEVRFIPKIFYYYKNEFIQTYRIDLHHRVVVVGSFSIIITNFSTQISNFHGKIRIAIKYLAYLYICIINGLSQLTAFISTKCQNRSICLVVFYSR